MSRDAARLGRALLIALVLHGADEPRWRTVNREARELLQAKDYAKLRGALIELTPLIPGNPRIAYNLAAAEARLGNREAALAALRNWAAMGVTADPGADEDFVSLRETAEFREILDRVARHKERVGQSTLAFRLPAPDLLLEDIAYDPKARRFFLSSVRKGAIFTADGREFARVPWAAMALRVDAARRRLWATTGYLPNCEACDPADKDKTAAIAFDLDTGEQKLRVDSPVRGLLGDMTIGRGGDLFLSEGTYGAVLRLKTGSTAMERLDQEGEFPAPQTAALSADEKILYVPDYIRGIAAMRLDSRMDTRQVDWLQPAPGIALSGIDGLYLHRGSFVAVQNGVTPERVVRFPLDLRRQELIEANTPNLGEPTHGVFVDDDFYFIANSGWNEYGRDGKKKPGSPPVATEVRKVRLR
jgi:hypothetical protein